MASLTSSNLMDLMLDEEVDHRDESTKESACKVFPISHGFGVGKAQGKTAQCPRYCGNKVGDHEDIVPVMIVC